jgi:hypothetical protein
VSLVKYWNPLPVITHLVDESTGGQRTLCGVTIRDGWESGEEWDYAADAYCGCHRCSAIATSLAASPAAQDQGEGNGL